MSSEPFPDLLEPDSTSSSGSKKSKKQPKGILKNANPNATYHKHHHRRKLEELVKLENNHENSGRQPEIIPTTHTHHGRHKHHHEHHKHRSTSSRYVNSKVLQGSSLAKPQATNQLLWSVEGRL